MRSLLFAGTAFAAAALVFVVQPLVGRQLLPLAGGTPVVWNTCLVFFQAVLLAGYVYAHGVTKLPPGRQWAAHLAVSAVAAAVLILGGGLRPDAGFLPADGDAPPVVGLLLALAACAGIPFFVLSATAPLVQHWFAAAGGKNPYPLYAASNAGSLLGLLAYPFAVEPYFPVSDQRAGWAVGFAVAVVLVAACGFAGRRGVAVLSHADEPRGTEMSRPRRFALAALPSALLVAVTTHITTDVAPIPLLWVVPLALYLVSFILAFGRWPDALHKMLARTVPMALCFLAITLLTAATEPMPVVAGLHLTAFFLVALLCHAELARGRPPANRLTAFYIATSFGGVAGGFLVTVVAPRVFPGPVEYPVLVVLAALVRPAGMANPRPVSRFDVLAPVSLGVVTFALVKFVPMLMPAADPADPAAGMIQRVVRGGLAFGVPAAAAFALAWRPGRFAAALGFVFLAGAFAPGPHGETLAAARNDYGTLRVTRTPDGFINLVHGTTRHGRQKIGEPANPEPRMYYHRRGPLGRLFAGLPAPPRRVGGVGLGCGAAAAYARPGDAWTFFEINPEVTRLARDENYFTFLAAHPADVIHGDARRTLATQPDAAFDVLILDAFSSDAVPVHLLTQEAFAGYARVLAPGGVMAFHVSNRYLDLPPVVARLAAAGDWVVRMDEDGAVSDAESADGKSPSTWVIVARSLAPRGTLQPVPPAPGPAWTDDFANLLGAWKWGE